MMERSACYETPRSKIPIPLQTRSQTHPSSMYNTPRNHRSNDINTPTSLKSEPATTTRASHEKRAEHCSVSDDELQFALTVVEMIVAKMHECNRNVNKATLQSLTDQNQQRIVVRSMLMAPIISHLVKVCIAEEQQKQTPQKHFAKHQLLSFFIDYFQQTHPELKWPNIKQFTSSSSDQSKQLQLQLPQETNIPKPKIRKPKLQKPSKSDFLQQNHMEHASRSTPAAAAAASSHRRSIEMATTRDLRDSQKFDRFIDKVNEIGAKFEVMQHRTNDSLDSLRSKQRDLDQKLKQKSNSNNQGKSASATSGSAAQNALLIEWEKSHHNLGTKQQQNIDLLRHQTEQFEQVAQRIKDALKQTDDAAVFESRFTFIDKQTKHLERKLNAVQQTVEDKAVCLEQTVKNALQKYQEMDDAALLISAGVKPDHIPFVAIGKPQQQRSQTLAERQQQQTTTSAASAMDEHERKLSFLYSMNESDTGFNYEQKRVEVKKIISDVLDCKHTMEFRSDKHRKPPSSSSMTMDCGAAVCDELDMENDGEFMQRIRHRIQETMTMIKRCKGRAPSKSMHVHWDQQQQQMRFVADDDDRNESLIEKHFGEVMQQAQSPAKPSSKQPRKMKGKTTETNVSTMQHRQTNIVRRTTKKPPQLQSICKPIAPPKPIFAEKRKPKMKKHKHKQKQRPKPTSTSSKPEQKQLQPRARSPMPSLINKSIQTFNCMDNGVQTDDLIHASIERDTVNIEPLTRSEHKLSNLCDNVLNDLLVKTEKTTTVEKRLSMETENGENNADNYRIYDSWNIAQPIIEQLITNAIQLSEQSPKLCIEEMINEQQIQQSVQSAHNHSNNYHNNNKQQQILRFSVTKSPLLKQQTQVIVHISPQKPKQAPNNPPRQNGIVQSPICKEYKQKLQNLQKNILRCSSPRPLSVIDKIKSFSVTTSTSCSSSSSSSSSASESSIATDLVSSIDTIEANRLLKKMKVTDSIVSGLTGISLDSSSLANSNDCGEDHDEDDTSSSAEYEQLKQSLQRQWGDIQLELNNW